MAGNKDANIIAIKTATIEVIVECPFCGHEQVEKPVVRMFKGDARNSDYKAAQCKSPECESWMDVPPIRVSHNG